ncbi:hypothetical protein E2C01_025711 [Portunus trituberculatus]|uniref:Uncharacterized protein n=1 Tax=Portunus trituberculatus TaxID=210409 RepID=A0A5B7EE30_PORTR|nr:hypothetical protein [Portunus trituberculatus]
MNGELLAPVVRRAARASSGAPASWMMMGGSEDVARCSQRSIKTVFKNVVYITSAPRRPPAFL